MLCVDSQLHFSVNLEEPSVYTKPAPEQEKVTRKVIPEPYQPEPTVEPKVVPPEPKLAPQKPQVPEPKVPEIKPETEAPKVKPSEKTPEAPKTRGNVVNSLIPADQLERHCVKLYVFLVLFHVAVICVFPVTL